MTRAAPTVICVLLTGCPVDRYDDIVGDPTYAPDPFTAELGAQCGNGDVEDGELCDDGNTDPGDYCSADCSEAGSLVFLEENGIWGLRLSGQRQGFDIDAKLNGVPRPLDNDAGLVRSFGDRCAVLDGGGIFANGGVEFGSNEYVDCAASDNGVCGLRDDGEIDCNSTTGDWTPVPKGPFVDLGVSMGEACAIDSVDSLICWGESPKLLGVPATPFDSVVGGTEPDFCGITQGRVWCSPEPGQAITGTDAVKVAVGAGLVCALFPDGRVGCAAPDESLPAFDFDERCVDIAVSGALACALTVRGQVICRSGLAG